MLSGLFGHWNHVPAMPCVAVEDFGHLAPGEITGFGATPMSSPTGIEVSSQVDGPQQGSNALQALVTKLLDRREQYRDPKARQAIKVEGQSLVEQGAVLEPH